MPKPARYRTIRPRGYQPAGMRVDVISGTDGQWLRVTYPNAILAGMTRTPAGLAALGINLADLEADHA